MEPATEHKCENEIARDKDNAVLNDVINKIVETEGYKDYDVATKFHSLVEQGFLGTTCEVNIKGTKENGEKETNLFVKIMNPDISTFVVVSDVYAKELFVYRNLAKMFDDLQTEFDVPEPERYKMVKSYSEFPPTVIILENMNKKGYKTQHRSKIVSLEFAVLAVKELAKFHALSFALRERRPKYFEQHISTLKHSLTFNEDWSNFVDNFLELTMKYVNDEVRRKLEVFKMMFIEKYKTYMEDDKFKISLCHGDYRPCNILAKETNGKVTEVIPIDYQLVYYGCPVMDLVYFIFASLDQKMRRNVPYLKDIYYSTMESFLTYFDVKIQNIFPRELFEAMYNQRLDYGLQTSLLLMPLLMASDETLTDLDTMASSTQNTDTACQERMMGIINDFIDWGYL